MGTLGGSNDGGLPGLPPEWGTIVIPDDPAELAGDAAKIRRELRRTVRRNRWQRRLGLPTKGSEDSSIRLPLLIMAIAVIATLTSLFAVAWPKPHRPPVAGQAAPTPVPDVTLVDASGAPVRLRDTLPAIIVLVEGCDCDSLLGDITRAASANVHVLTVTRSARAPTLPRVRPLADPNDSLRNRLGLPPAAGQASVALVETNGDIVRLIPRTKSLDEFRGALSALT